MYAWRHVKLKITMFHHFYTPVLALNRSKIMFSGKSIDSNVFVVCVWKPMEMCDRNFSILFLTVVPS